MTAGSTPDHLVSKPLTAAVFSLICYTIRVCSLERSLGLCSLGAGAVDRDAICRVHGAFGMGVKQAKKKTADRKRLTPSLASFRSAISNGSSMFLADIDERSTWARRLRDLIGDHVSDLGGEDMISSSEMVLVRRASMICLQLEMMESRWADNDGEASPQALQNYQRCVNTLRRTLEALGLKRRQKDITPSLSEYIAQKGREKALAAVGGEE